MFDVSVIIPVYNAEKTIHRCLNSILANTIQPLEIILIDDCSKDASLEICRQFEKKYSNIKVLHNKRNRGVSYTRNRGLQAAVGKYLMFVDSDDWIDTEYYANFYNTNTEEELKNTLLVCGYYNHDEKQNGLLDRFLWEDNGSYTECKLASIIEDLSGKCLIQQLWNKLFDADIVRSHNIRFDESISIGEDFRFILDYIEKGSVVHAVLINKPLYHYMRDQNGSLMYRVGHESVEEPLKNLRKMYKIMGMSEQQINETIVEKRKQQIELYAYLIMHNAGMKVKEKKHLIYELDYDNGKLLYKKNRKIYIKERIKRILTFK